MRKLVWVFPLVILCVGAQAAPWTWVEVGNITHGSDLQDLDMYGRKAAVIRGWRWLVTSSDAGRTWSEEDLRSTANISTAVNCCAIRGGRLYVGGNKFLAAKTASTPWKVRRPFGTTFNWHVYDIAIGPDPSEAVAVGAVTVRIPGAATNATRPLVVTTRDGGDTWNIENIDSSWSVPMSAVWMDRGIFVGARGHIWHGHPGGSWGRIVPLGLSSQQTVFDISAVRDTVWACADGGHVFKKQGGGPWQAVSGPWPGTARLMGIAFRSTRHGVVVGHGHFRETLVYHTEDGGTTWIVDRVGGTGWVGLRKVVPTTDADIKFLAIGDLPTDSDVHYDGRILAPVGFTIPPGWHPRLSPGRVPRPGPIPNPHK
ncbi:MAG: hypothetical protein J7M26_08750 [Armatimonadetes bacterium]|nr:hypothetical protein [Armatimonadota bacterium]